MWFRLEYLNDDETELVPDPELNVHRSVMATSFAMRILGLRRSLWDAIEELPTTYEPPAWETLILDAGGALPEVGPPLVLAFAALETRIEDALDFLARAYGVSPALWSWLNHRDDPRRMPSVEERLDALCRAIGSKSLKDEQELWEGSKHLRRGRNTFVHHGRAEIGGVAVDSQQARQLVQQADQILNWIEDLLPKAHRRPRHEFPMDIQVIQPVSQVSEDQAGPGEET